MPTLGCSEQKSSKKNLFILHFHRLYKQHLRLKHGPEHGYPYAIP